MTAKNTTITIYFGKERICSLPFDEANITVEPDNNYLYLEAANLETETAMRLPKKESTKKAPDKSEAK